MKIVIEKLFNFKFGWYNSDMQKIFNIFSKTLSLYLLSFVYLLFTVEF
jgi:hypothetical protein